MTRALPRLFAYGVADAFGRRGSAARRAVSGLRPGSCSWPTARAPARAGLQSRARSREALIAYLAYRYPGRYLAAGNTVRWRSPHEDPEAEASRPVAASRGAVTSRRLHPSTAVHSRMCRGPPRPRAARSSRRPEVRAGRPPRPPMSRGPRWWRAHLLDAGRRQVGTGRPWPRHLEPDLLHLALQGVDEFGYDALFAETILPVFEFLTRCGGGWRRRGWSTCPPRGAGLIIPNHSGVLPWDGAMIKLALRHHIPSGANAGCWRWTCSRCCPSCPIAREDGAVRRTRTTGSGCCGTASWSASSRRASRAWQAVPRTVSAGALRARGLRAAGPAHGGAPDPVCGGRRGRDPSRFMYSSASC